MRTSVQLSLQFSFLYAVLSSLIFAMAFWFTEYEIQDWVRDQMRGDASTLASIYEDGGSDALLDRVNSLAEVSFENARIYQLQDGNGNIVSGNISAKIVSPIPDTLPVEAVDLTDNTDFEVETYWMREDQIGPYYLIQGSGDHMVSEILEALSIALVLGFFTVIIVGVFAGIRVGRLTEKRIIPILDALTKISAGELKARIPEGATGGDDLSRVTAAINIMLAQIERLLVSQEQISNDIAHDMRTPLQRLRQRLEAMSEGGNISAEDVEASLKLTEDIIATFNALLRIAQIEASDRRERFEKSDLKEIVLNVVEVFEPAAEDAGMLLKTDLPKEPLGMLCDRSLLTQMISNLVENAIKHSSDGTQIIITLKQNFNGVILRVQDNGVGIDIDDREQVFRRFYRNEQSRNSPGNGLGLTLVKAIAEMHDAEVSLSDVNPGASFEILFSK